MTQKLITLVAAAVFASSLHAQETPTKPSILEAILLPRVSDELRKEGVPDDDVRVAIEEAMRKRLPPDETKQVLDETARTVRETGPIDNFGAYVQTQLDSGLRGRELAAAIHAEHARRGIGKGKKLKVEKARGGPAAVKPKRDPGDVRVKGDLKVEQPDSGPPKVKVEGPKGKQQPAAVQEAEDEMKRKKDEAAAKVRGRRPKPDTTRASGGR